MNATEPWSTKLGKPREMVEPQVTRFELRVEDAEVVMLRKFEAAHKANDMAEMNRLTIALEELRAAVAIVQTWHIPTSALTTLEEK